jgi:hypothetical protein
VAALTEEGTAAVEVHTPAQKWWSGDRGEHWVSVGWGRGCRLMLGEEEIG